MSNDRRGAGATHDAVPPTTAAVAMAVLTAGDGLDREAVRRRAEAYQSALRQSHADPTPKMYAIRCSTARRSAADVPALLDALEAAEAREDALRAAIRLADALRTEGGAS